MVQPLIVSVGTEIVVLNCGCNRGLNDPPLPLGELVVDGDRLEFPVPPAGDVAGVAACAAATDAPGAAARWPPPPPPPVAELPSVLAGAAPGGAPAGPAETPLSVPAEPPPPPPPPPLLELELLVEGALGSGPPPALG
ncbi:MAG TPA: hypothetical protein VGP63_26770 [Planctomycetaceae bacterium]|jgi:hypothetical protein|nr:hypothetical protein [Planctomycetaceae bacterium]